MTAAPSQAMGAAAIVRRVITRSRPLIDRAGAAGCFLALALLFGATPGGAQAPVAPSRGDPSSADTVRWATVTYLAGRSVYVSAGRDDGLREGAELDVVRRGSPVARLRVVVVSSRRASCEILNGAESLAVAIGDSVRFTVDRSANRTIAQAPADSGAAGQRSAADPRSATQHAAPDVAAGAAPRSLRALGIRGRVGVRYMIVAQRDSGAVRLSQPAADVRIDGQRIAGSPIGVSIDARGRRTYLTRSDTGATRTDSRTHVYQLSASLSTAHGARVTVGRQFTEAFANVSLYDGISAQLAGRRWGTGLFAGTQPTAATMSFSTEVKEYGAYVQAHGDAGATRRWTMTAGAIGSYHASEPNREFAFTHFAVTTPRAQLYAVQEIDYNRGWKSAAGERTLQPTSTFVSAHVRPWNALTLHAGFDTRRNVRLWRDLVSPETEFDDRFRQGVWGGASLRAGHLRFTADVRSSDGGDSSGTRATAASGSVGIDGIGRSLVAAQLRSAHFRSPWLEGWLHSGSASVSPWDGRLRVELEGGIRDQRDRPGVSVTGTLGRSRVHWFGLNTDVALGRSWYLLLTATRETGGWDSAQQGYASLSWRF